MKAADSRKKKAKRKMVVFFLVFGVLRGEMSVISQPLKGLLCC